MRATEQFAADIKTQLGEQADGVAFEEGEPLDALGVMVAMVLARD